MDRRATAESAEQAGALSPPLSASLPTDDDVQKVRDHQGPREALAVVEQFTLAVADVPQLGRADVGRVRRV